MGIVVPQISNYILKDLRVDNSYWVFLAGTIFLPIGSILIGYISDKSKGYKGLVTGLTILCSLSLFFFGDPQGSIIYFILTWGGFIFSIISVMTLINVACLQSGLEKSKFGIVRLAGTIGFMMPNLFILIFSKKALLSFIPIAAKSLIQFSSLLFLISLGPLILLPSHRKIPRKRNVKLPQIISLIFKTKFGLFTLVMSLFYFGFSSADYVIGAYIKPIDFSYDPIATTWLLGTSLEVIFFLVSAKVVTKTNEINFIILAIISAIVRFAIMVLYPPTALIIVIQVLHGIHFSPAHLGVILFIEKRVDGNYLASANASFMILARSTGEGLGAVVLGSLAQAGQFKQSFILCLFVNVLVLILIFALFKKKKSTDIIP